MDVSSVAITQLLDDWRGGNQQAYNELAAAVYSELKGKARYYLGKERIDHTLQATGLVHEVYVRMLDVDVAWNNRNHFLAIAASQMRRILVDYARARRADKRGGNILHVTLNDEVLLGGGQNPDLLDLDEALLNLMELDPHASKTVELYFFGGLTYEEIAAVLEVSPATVDRKLRFAKAWLTRTMTCNA